VAAADSYDRSKNHLEERLMSWLLRHRLGLYFRNSIWIFPVVSILAGLMAVSLLHRIEVALDWRLNIGPDTARTVISVVAGSMFSLVVVSSSAVLVAVQLASAQLTPRIIGFVYRSSARKFSLALFVFTFTFSVAVLVRIENTVPWLTCYLAAYGFLVNLAVFLFFIDGMGKMLRPSAVVRDVALTCRKVVRLMYPRPQNTEHAKPIEEIKSMEEPPTQVVANVFDGVVLAFDPAGLIALAHRENCLIELVPEIGEFVAAGSPLFRVFGSQQKLSEDELRKSVAIGQERTFEQDPMFAFRVIVDIAAKALSPAINDPTTAVLAIDQLHHLLRDVGGRYLAEGIEKDRQGNARLVYRTPNWEDFVHLAVTEIRQYGRDSIQVMRRLRAMLENLIDTLPALRAPALENQLRLLGASSQRMFLDIEDRTLAETGDLQGMGGGGHSERRVQANTSIRSVAVSGGGLSEPVRSTTA